MKNVYELTKKIGRQAVPYLVAASVALSGCNSEISEKKKDCLRLYNVLLESPYRLADKNHNGALDLKEQAEFMEALRDDKLMTGENFPEIFTNREEFKSHLNETWYLDEVHDGLEAAFSHYYNEIKPEYGGR